MNTVLHLQNAKLIQRIEDLEGDIEWLRGEVPKITKMVMRLRSKFRLQKSVAKILFELSDGKEKTHERLFYVCAKNQDADIGIVTVYICYLRRAGFKIENIHGIGYCLHQNDAVRIQALIAQVS